MGHLESGPMSAYVQVLSDHQLSEVRRPASQRPPSLRTNSVQGETGRRPTPPKNPSPSGRNARQEAIIPRSRVPEFAQGKEATETPARVSERVRDTISGQAVSRTREVLSGGHLVHEEADRDAKWRLRESREVHVEDAWQMAEQLKVGEEPSLRAGLERISRISPPLRALVEKKVLPSIDASRNSSTYLPPHSHINKYADGAAHLQKRYRRLPGEKESVLSMLQRAGESTPQIAPAIDEFERIYGEDIAAAEQSDGGFPDKLFLEELNDPRRTPISTEIDMEEWQGVYPKLDFRSFVGPYGSRYGSHGRRVHECSVTTASAPELAKMSVAQEESTGWNSFEAYLHAIRTGANEEKGWADDEAVKDAQERAEAYRQVYGYDSSDTYGAEDDVAHDEAEAKSNEAAV